MRVAALDIGTNTVLQLVADVEGGEVVKVLSDSATVVRLVQGVHQTRQLHPDALGRLEECLKRYKTLRTALQPDQVLACATSAARDVSNRQALLDLGAQYDVPIQVISGEAEAEFSFKGAFRSSPSENALVIDIGGGSTELVLGGPRGLQQRISLNIGSVRLTEMFISQHPVADNVLHQVGHFVQSSIAEAKTLLDQAKVAVAVAGTATTLAAIDMNKAFAAEEVQDHRLSSSTLQALTRRLAACDLQNRKKIAGLDPGRADVIVAGAVILSEISKMLPMSIHVSTLGLRYGLAKEMGRVQ